MKKKILRLGLLLLLPIIALGYYFFTRNNESNVQVTTAKVSKGTLVTSISVSGSITSGNTTNMSTKASGTVTKVYVKNGDLVKSGAKILDVALDSDGIERKSSAWEAYLKAQEEVVSATKEKQDLSIQVWQDKQAILDAEDLWEIAASNADLSDSERHQIEEAVVQAKLRFEVDALKLSHADAIISAKKTSERAAYLDYQDVSGTILAPADGIVNNLTLTVGSTLTASTSQSTTTGSTYASSQVIGFVRAASNEYQAKVNLTEVDVTKVSAGQKVNITLEAHSDKTFSGKVLAVDISGTSSSGVTTYPATIAMDPTELPIYPNMSVSATIITNIASDVLLVPSSAITKNDDARTVQVVTDGGNKTVEVVLGDSNGSQTVVTSGLSEGELVVTQSSTAAKNNNVSSDFGGTRGGGMQIPMGGGM